MPFPSWVEGEGKDRGQFILLSDSLSSTGCPRGGPFSGSQCRRVPCSLWCPKLSSVQCPRSLLPGTGAGCPCVGRKKSVPLHLDERCRSISPWQQRVSPEGRLVSWGIWFSPGRPIRSQTSCRQFGPALWSWGPIPLPHSPLLVTRF